MMAILDTIRKREPKNSATSSRKGSKKQKKSATFVRPKVSSQRHALLSQVLVAPVVTEKSMRLATLQQYMFEVYPQTRKNEVREAVEVVYGVPVKHVRISVSKPRVRQFGRKVGKTKGCKRAIVTVKAGYRIDFFTEAA